MTAVLWADTLVDDKNRLLKLTAYNLFNEDAATPATSYTDKTGSTVSTAPRVTSSRGMTNLWLASGLYWVQIPGQELIEFEVDGGGGTGGVISVNGRAGTVTGLAEQSALTTETSARIAGDASTLTSAEAYVEALIANRVIKDPVRVVATGNVNISSPGAVIDTVTMATGNRVLLAGQTTGSQNGLYVYASSTTAMTRATDTNTSAEMTAGLLVVVTEGSTNNRDTVWELQTDDPIVLGTTSLTFAKTLGVGLGFALSTDLITEAATARAAEAANAAAITSEASTRASAVASEAVTRAAADTANATAISNEAASRVSGDASTLSTAGAYTDTQVAGAVGGSTPLDGSVTNVKVASGAAIDQSKIAGLVAALAAKYVKPGSGIPDTDLTAAVQSLLALAASAVQVDGTGKLASSILPALATNETLTVANQAARLALTTSQVQLGDLVIQSDTSKKYWLGASDPSLTGSWIEIQHPDLVTSVMGQVGAVTGLALAADLTTEVANRAAAITSEATSRANGDAGTLASANAYTDDALEGFSGLSTVSWAPPDLVSPTTITLANTSGGRKAIMDPTLDYIVVMPSTPITVASGVELNGGRNVVLIGGEIHFDTEHNPADAKTNRALFIKGNSAQTVPRVVHVEGLKISGAMVKEGIDVDGQSEPGLTVRLQNIDCEAVLQGSLAGHHADFFQGYNGPTNLQLDRVKANTSYQGFMIQPRQFGTSPVDTYTYRRTEIVGTSASGALFYQVTGVAGDTMPENVIDRVYVTPNPSKTYPSQVLYEDPAFFPGVVNGPAPDSVGVTGNPGVAYASPGYADPTGIGAEVAALADDLSAEATTRASADTTNATAIAAEATTARAAESANATAITNEATARVSGDASTLSSAQIYTDAAISNRDIKENARVAVSTNINASSPGATLDGVSMINGDRILLVGQTTGSQNGLFTWLGASTALSRAGDANQTAEVTTGMLVPVTEGTNTGIWELTTTGSVTIGTTPQTFQKVAGFGFALAADLTTEVTRATAAEGTNATAITAEATARATADTDLAADLADEATTARAAESTNASAITSEASTRAAADTTNANAISSEATTRAAADTANATAITAEATTARAAESANATAITSEASTRASADTANAAAITSEATTARAAELTKAVRADLPVNAKTDYGAVGDGTTDDTTALQAFITYCIVNNKRGYVPAGTYKITAALNFTYRAYWAIEGAGRNITVIKQYTDNVPIFNLGSDSVSFMHTFTIKGFSFDYANVQPAANTNANPIQYNKMVFEGRIESCAFNRGSFATRIATASDAPWGMIYDELQFGSGLTGGAMDWSLGTAATPNNKFGRMEIDCQNMVGPVFTVRGYNFEIENLEFLSANLGAQLFLFKAGGQVEIGSMKLEQGSYTGGGVNLFQFESGSHAHIGHLSIGGSAMVVTPSAALSLVNVGSGAHVTIGDINSAASATVTNGYLVTSAGQCEIGRYTTANGWALQNNSGSSSGDNIRVAAWLNDKLSGNKGDADYTVTLGDPNVIMCQTAFTAQRTITLPSDGPNLHNGLYYEIVFDGAINGANTALVKAGATTLATISTDKTVVRYTWRRHATAISGWVQTRLTGPKTDVQVFTANGTWTKPTGAQSVDVILVGPGGAGGSGRRGAAGTVRCAGGGGGGGSVTRKTVPASVLGSTESVVVGAAATGGAAVTADDTNGNNGSGGGVATTFGTNFMRASYGGNGQGGTAAASTGGNSSLGMYNGVAGASGSGSGGAGSGGGNTNEGASGGGSGGGITAADAVSNGGSGGATPYSFTNVGGGTAGTAGGAGGAGASAPTNSGNAGAGGGGGASSITAAAGTGGAAGNYGAGGGGGGASLNGNNSGAGGNSGPGIAVIITHF